MFARFRCAIAPVALAAGMLFAGASEVVAQPDPALPGTCYATLGNNTSNPGALVSVDLGTGAGVLIGPTGILGQLNDPGVPALAIKTTGEIYAADIGSPSRLYRVDATTGAATLIATTSLNSLTAIAFNGLDILWGVDIGGTLHVLVDSTGASYPIGPTGVFIKGIAFDPIDGALWGTDASGGVYTIDYHTGAATLVGNTGLAPSPDICFDVAGVLYASSGGGFTANNLITIDKSTGAGTVVGSIGYAAVAGLACRLDRTVSVAVQAYAAAWVGTHVEVTWRLIDIEGTISFAAYRAERDGPFLPLPEAEIQSRGGAHLMIDRDTSPGATYAYRVLVYEDGEAVTSFETTVTIPRLVTALDQNTPNPFNPDTRIPFAVGNPGRVALRIYDVSGKRVRTLVDGSLPAGEYTESWDGRDDHGIPVAGGVYFYRLTTGTRALTRKAVLLK